MGDSALVMLSGGLDSATCLYWAKSKFSEVSAVTFNYFGRLVNERRAAIRLASRAGVTDLIEIDLPFMKEASDFDNGYSGKTKSDFAGMRSSYVPARNLIFYSIAAHYAEFLGITNIIGGHNHHDAQFFKDASKKYIQKLNSLFREGCLLCNGRAYRILLPLARMERREIVKLALRLNTPIELTWSCHRKGSIHCGRCYACRQRLRAFRSLGMPDPVFKK